MLLKMQNENDGGWKGAGHAEDNPVVATSLALLFLRPETSERPRGEKNPKQ